MTRHVPLIHILLIVLLGFAVYHNTLGGAFILDDIRLIQDSFFIKSWANFGKLFTRQSHVNAFQQEGGFRPVNTVSYMADYSLWGLNPEGYHFTNILIHAAVAVLLYATARTLFASPALAFWAALFFVSHPVHAEVVAYISGRNEALALFFLLFSFLLYLKALAKRNVIFTAASLLAYVLALLSKETAFVFPLLLVFYHLAFRKKVNWGAFLSVIAASAFYLWLRMFVFKSARLDAGSVATMAERIPGVFVAFMNYLRLLIFPFNLHLDYGKRLFSWSDPRVLFGAAIFLVFIVLLVRLRKRDRLAFFGMGWFLFSFLPVSNLYPLPYYMAEHWLYIPSVGIFLILGGAIASLNTLSGKHRLTKFLAPALLIFYACLTVAQNRYWLEPIPFYLRTLKFNPQNASMETALGSAYEKEKRFSEAIQAYARAMRVQPDYVKAYNNLGLLYHHQGEVAKAKALFGLAIKVNPRFAQSYNNLGAIYAESDDKEKAIALFKKAITLQSNLASAYYNLGNVYSDMGRDQEAVNAFREAIKIDLNYAKVYDRLGVVLRRQRRFDEAVAAGETAVRLSPWDADFFYNLSSAYLEQGRTKEAVAACRRALELDSENVVFMNTLASLYKTLGRHDKAIELYEKAIALEPQNPVLYFNLGNVSLGLGRRKEAIDRYKKAIELKPDFAEAYDNLSVAYYYESSYSEAIAAADKAHELGVANAELLEALKPYRPTTPEPSSAPSSSAPASVNETKTDTRL